MKDEHPARLYEIDALRGVAALCVVIFHLKVMTDHPGGLLGMETAFGRWGNAYLWTAVDLFFLISGFIFAHVYLRNDRIKSGTTVRGYAMARIARIYPLHVLTLLVVATIVWAGVPLAPPFDHKVVFYDGYHFALNVLMLQASGIEHGFSFNSPAWSLTSEFVCYALFYALARVGGRWLVIGGLGAIAAGILSHIDPGLLPIPTRIGRGLVGFFVGVFLHRYRAPLQQTPFVIVATLSVVTLSSASWFERSGINVGVMMALFAWPWVVLTCLHPLSSRLLRASPMQFLGDLSYSTYLIHIPLALVFLTLNGGRYFAITDFIWLAPIYLVTLLVIAQLSFTYFEAPMRRRIRMIGG